MFTVPTILLALATITTANPIAAPGPAITSPPSLTRRDGPQVTTISVSNCRVYQDPHEGESGCSCDGYGSLLSMTSKGDSTCDYSSIVTATDTSYNGFPYTKTYSNSGITAYAQSTVLSNGGDWYGTGSSTVIQAGTSLSLEMAPSSSANVGTVTDDGSALFTAVSSAIASACPPPSGGATLSACANDAKVTGLDYIDVAELYHDGTLDIEIPIASVSDADVLNALIVFIAAGVQSNAAFSGNQANMRYTCDKTQVPVCQELNTDWNITLANIPARMQALYSEQTDDTKGEVEIQNLEVSMSMKAGASDFKCSDAGTALSVIAAVASVIPGLGWLSGGAVGSVARAGLSLTCNLES